MKVDFLPFENFKKQFEDTDKEKIIDYLYNCENNLIQCIDSKADIITNIYTLNSKLRKDIELLYRGEYNKGNMTDDMQHELANYLQELLKEDVFNID